MKDSGLGLTNGNVIVEPTKQQPTSAVLVDFTSNSASEPCPLVAKASNPVPTAEQVRSRQTTAQSSSPLRRKGLEPSSELLSAVGGRDSEELFFSNREQNRAVEPISDLGPRDQTACFTRIDRPIQDPNADFRYSRVLHRELHQKTGHPHPTSHSSSSHSSFSRVPDMDPLIQRSIMAQSWHPHSWTARALHFNRVPPAEPEFHETETAPPIQQKRVPLTNNSFSLERRKDKAARSQLDNMEPTITPRRMGNLKAEPWQDKSGSGAGARLFIKGGQVVNDDSMYHADIVVEDGIIKQVAPNLPTPAGARTIDAAGKLVFPGGIDAQTHFQIPLASGITSVDDFLQGTKAAVAGGTTTVIETALPVAGESLVNSYNRWRSWADSKVVCNYGLCVAVSQLNEKTRQDMVELTKDKGVNSFVLSMAAGEDGQQPLKDDQLFQAFQLCKQIGALPRVHAENGDIVKELEKRMLSLGVTGPEGHLQSRPEQLETEATNRACVLAQQANSPIYLLHVTSRGAAQTVTRMRKKGVVAYAEVTAAALATDGTHYFNRCWRHAAAHVVAPPLRAQPDTPDALLDMLASGELLVSASDHRTFNSEQKAAGRGDFTKIPQGVNGAEERMALIWQRGVESGKMDPMRFVAVTSTNAAKIFNLYPKKGRIAGGADADLVVWDPQAKWTISAKSQQSKCDFNVFEGVQCYGSPVVTIVAGRVAAENGQVLAAQGSGHWTPLPPHCPFVFSVIQQRERVCLPEKVDRSLVSEGGVGVYETPLVPRTMSQQRSADFHNRPATRAGTRNQLDSSFTIAGILPDSGSQYDDNKAIHMSNKKITQPPGGKSSGLW